MVETQNKITNIVEASVSEINSQLPKAQRLSLSKSQVIVGLDSSLDSLGLVTFVANIEDKLIAEGLECCLLDELVKEYEVHPFITTDSMIKWIHEKVCQDG